MNRFAAALVLASVPMPAMAQVTTPVILPDGTILDVSAQGRTSRVPDIATIRAGVMTQSATAAGALSENAQRMARVLDALKRAGIAARDISTANVGLTPQYRYVENQAPVVTGYQASNSVAVRFRAIDKAGAVLDALVSEGANQIDGPNLAIDNPDAALDEARVDAVKRARARAELYARASGLTVSRILSIAESGENNGGSPPPIYYARAKAENASTQIAPGETDVTVMLNVRFLLK